SFSHVFAQPGTYHYYDGNYQFLTGTVDVGPQPVPPTTMPSTFQVGLNGNVGWKVEGLSSSTANLLVSHNLAVSVSVPQLPGLTITPVTESGTLVQSIDLATRVESAGTATDLIEHLLDAYASASSGSYGYNSGFGNIISQMSATATSDPSYTPWWVNGPLSNGSTVQVTRDMRLTVTLALQLTSTSLSLDQRMRNGASTLDMSSILAAMTATLWMTLSVAGVAAGAIIAFSLWLTRRERRSAMPEAAPAPVSAPSTPPSTTS